LSHDSFFAITHRDKEVLVTRPVVVGEDLPAADKQAQLSGKSDKSKDKSATREEGGATPTSQTPVPAEETISTVVVESKLVSYSLGQVLSSLYASIDRVCTNAHDKHTFAKDMFLTSTHAQRMEEDHFDSYVPAKGALDTLPGLRTNRSNASSHQKLPFRARSRGTSHAGSTAGSVAGSTRRRHQKLQSSNASLASYNSKASKGRNKKHEHEVEPAPVEQLNSGPFNDLSLIVFAQLKNRDRSRNFRAHRRDRRHEEVLALLQEESDLLAQAALKKRGSAR